MMQGIDSGVDGVVFLGYHAGAGQQGVLAHTYLANSVTGVWLGGEPAGEGGLNAALAAEHGVPVLLVTGDDRACAEAAAYAPDAERVAVKTCVSRYAAICLPPARTAEMITQAAAAAMRRAGRGPRRPAPHRIEVEFDAAHLADDAAVVPTVEQLGVHRVGFDAPDMTAAMRAFKIVTAIAAGAVQGACGSRGCGGGDRPGAKVRGWALGRGDGCAWSSSPFGIEEGRPWPRSPASMAGAQRVRACRVRAVRSFGGGVFGGTGPAGRGCRGVEARGRGSWSASLGVSGGAVIRARRACRPGRG